LKTIPYYQNWKSCTEAADLAKQYQIPTLLDPPKAANTF